MAKLGAVDARSELISEARRAVRRLDPTEKPGLVLIGISGSAPLAMSALGPMGTLLVDRYLLTVTARSLYVHRGSLLKNRPGKLVHVIPLAETGGLVARVKRGKARSALYLRFPGKAKPTRLSITYLSRDEMERFLGMFPEGAYARSALRSDGARLPVAPPVKVGAGWRRHGESA